VRLSAVPAHALTLRNGHQIVATAQRLGIPARQSRALSKGVQLLRAPREYALRRRLARELLDEVTPPFTVSDGFAAFTVGDLPHGDAALLACQAVADSERAAYREQPGEKGFLRSLLSADTLEAHPAVLDFATSPEMVAVLAEYLGAVPTLSDVRLWWSVPTAAGTPVSSSQMFHRDHEDYRQVKVFVNVHEVTEDGGPLSFVHATKSEQIVRALGGTRGRLADADVEPHLGPGDLVVLTGPPGLAAMVDTCSCLHFGSRNETSERLVLMLHYVGYHSIVEPDVKVLTPAVRTSRRPTHPAVAALLRVRPHGM
jgi:hypothetical protein